MWRSDRYPRRSDGRPQMFVMTEVNCCCCCPTPLPLPLTLLLAPLVAPRFVAGADVDLLGVVASAAAVR